MKAAGAFYARVSTDGQAGGDKTSLGEQERICRSILQEREGLEGAEAYIDAGRSGTHDDLENRPAMQKLLSDAAAGKFTHLAVYAEDRLARNTEVAALIASALRRAQITIHTQRGQVDLEEFGGKPLYYITGLLAEEEGRKIRERTLRGKRGRARGGLFAGSQQPYGYAWDKAEKRPRPIPEECELVKLVFELADSRKVTVQDIAREVNRRGLKPREGNRWWATHVSHTLADERYKGEWYAWVDSDSGEKYPAKSELLPDPLVTPEQWARVQKVIADHRKRTRRKVQHNFLLAGLAYCAECGAPLTGRIVGEEPKVLYYACSRGQRTVRKNPPLCPAKYIPAKPLDSAVWALAEQVLTNPELLEEWAEKTGQDTLPERYAELGRVEVKVKQCKQRLRVIYESHEDGSYNREEFLERRDEAQAELTAWEERATAIRASVEEKEKRASSLDAKQERLAEFRDGYERLTLEERRAVLRVLDFRVEVGCEDWGVPPTQGRNLDVEIATCLDPFLSVTDSPLCRVDPEHGASVVEPAGHRRRHARHEKRRAGIRDGECPPYMGRATWRERSHSPAAANANRRVTPPAARSAR